MNYDINELLDNIMNTFINKDISKRISYSLEIYLIDDINYIVKLLKHFIDTSMKNKYFPNLIYLLALLLKRIKVLIKSEPYFVTGFNQRVHYLKYIIDSKNSLANYFFIMHYYVYGESIYINNIERLIELNSDYNMKKFMILADKNTDVSYDLSNDDYLLSAMLSMSENIFKTYSGEYGYSHMMSYYVYELCIKSSNYILFSIILNKLGKDSISYFIIDKILITILFMKKNADKRVSNAIEILRIVLNTNVSIDRYQFEIIFKNAPQLKHLASLRYNNLLTDRKSKSMLQYLEIRLPIINKLFDLSSYKKDIIFVNILNEVGIKDSYFIKNSLLSDEHKKKIFLLFLYYYDKKENVVSALKKVLPQFIK